MKKWISICMTVLFCSLLTFGTTCWANEPEGNAPVDIRLDGVFIQPYLYWNYTDEQWDTELEVLKSIGVKSIIMGDTLLIHSNSPWDFFYPSKMPEAQEGGYFKDAIGPLLEKCQKYGLTVYLGMGCIDSHWWDSKLAEPEDAAWYTQFCRDSARVAEDIYNLYHEKYADTFVGWYAVPEIWNDRVWDDDKARSTYADTISGGFNILLEQLEKLNPDMPVLFSPFSGRQDRCSFESTQKFYTEFFQKTNFRKIDAILPMDNIGGGGMQLPYLDSYTKMYCDAIAAGGNKLQFWSNNENFIQNGTDPLGPSETWGTASVGRYIQQIGTTRKYAGQTYSFSYSHYYSPVTTIAGYHETYLSYIKTGKLDSQPPLAPNRVKTQRVSDGLQLTWSGLYDDKGVSRVNIYKNGKFYDYVMASNALAIPGAVFKAPDQFTDPDIGGSATLKEPIVYELEAVDCAGNVSKERAKVVVSGRKYDNGITLDTPYLDQWNPNDPMGLKRPVWVNDVNEDNQISALDALWVLENVADLRALTTAQHRAADSNGDGKIRSVDAMRILELVAGLYTGITK